MLCVQMPNTSVLSADGSRTRGNCPVDSFATLQPCHHDDCGLKNEKDFYDSIQKQCCLHLYAVEFFIQYRRSADTYPCLVCEEHQRNYKRVKNVGNISYLSSN